jgi:glucans biosynthesis protein C
VPISISIAVECEEKCPVQTFAHTHDRYHALDALRGFAMFLGVVLHVAIPYLHTPFTKWPVQDEHRSTVFDLLLLTIHDFRMQLFFLLAGLFGCLLYKRYGAIGVAKHRLKRVAIPLVAAFLILLPVLQAVSVYVAATAYRERPGDPNLPQGFDQVLSAGDSPSAAVVNHFTSGTFLRYMIPAHLWFLWYLLIFFAVMLPLALLGDRLRERSLGGAWDGFFTWLFQSRWRWVVLAVSTCVMLVPMEKPIGPDTPFSWLPPVHLLAYYFLFFVVGWTLYRHRESLGRFVGNWRFSLGAAFLCVFPAALACLFMATSPESVGAGSGTPFEWLAMPALALFTWLLIGGLIGLFMHCLSNESRSIRWLAESSYWCYLASLPPIVLFQFLVVSWDIPAIVKFAVVTSATMALLLITYRYLVRYTWLGSMLNGPRFKPARSQVEVQAQELAVAGR